MKIVGAVADAPGVAAGLARKLAAASVRGAAQHYQALLIGERIGVFAIHRPEESLDQMYGLRSEDGLDRAWFAGELMQADACGEGIAIDVDAAISALRRHQPGSYLGVRVDAKERLTLYTDPWGLNWTFIRRAPGAALFGSNYRALCGAVDSQLTLDRDAGLLELCLGYVPDCSTLYKEISTAPPGAALRLSARCADASDQLTSSYGSDWVGRSAEAKFARLDELFAAMAERMARAADGAVCITLTAGARMAAASLQRAGALGPMLSFGEPASEVVQRAGEFAHRCDPHPDWTCFRHEQTSYDHWRSMIQSLGNAGVVQWCGWADDWMSFVRARSAHCAIGYLGEATSGKFIGVLRSEHERGPRADGLQPWARRWISYSLAQGEWADSELLGTAARARLLPASSERFAAIASGVHCELPYQYGLHCDYVTRQRRWVGAQMELLSGYVKPLAFFVDKPYREFWASVGLDDLRGQALYGAYAQQRFPRLFPHTSGRTTNLAWRIGRRLRSELAALRGMAPIASPPAPVVHSRMLAAHYPVILGEFDRSAGALSDMLDVSRTRAEIESMAAGKPSGRLTTLMLIRLVNLLHLLGLQASGERDARSGAAHSGTE